MKDLRIEKEPEKKPAQQPQIPDDPAILGVSVSPPLLLQEKGSLQASRLFLCDEVFRM